MSLKAVNSSAAGERTQPFILALALLGNLGQVASHHCSILSLQYMCVSPS